MSYFTQSLLYIPQYTEQYQSLAEQVYLHSIDQELNQSLSLKDRRDLNRNYVQSDIFVKRSIIMAWNNKKIRKQICSTNLTSQMSKISKIVQMGQKIHDNNNNTSRNTVQNTIRQGGIFFQQIHPSDVQKNQQDHIFDYLLHMKLAKGEQIFKVQQIKRKQKKKPSGKQCQCCGKDNVRGHKCMHTLCQKKCGKSSLKRLQSYRRQGTDADYSNSKDENWSSQNVQGQIKKVIQQRDINQKQLASSYHKQATNTPQNLKRRIPSHQGSNLKSKSSNSQFNQPSQQLILSIQKLLTDQLSNNFTYRVIQIKQYQQENSRSLQQQKQDMEIEQFENYSERNNKRNQKYNENYPIKEEDLKMKEEIEERGIYDNLLRFVDPFLTKNINNQKNNNRNVNNNMLKSQPTRTIQQQYRLNFQQQEQLQKQLLLQAQYQRKAAINNQQHHNSKQSGDNKRYQSDQNRKPLLEQKQKQQYNRHKRKSEQYQNQMKQQQQEFNKFQKPEEKDHISDIQSRSDLSEKIKSKAKGAPKERITQKQKHRMNQKFQLEEKLVDEKKQLPAEIKKQQYNMQSEDDIIEQNGEQEDNPNHNLSSEDEVLKKDKQQINAAQSNILQFDRQQQQKLLIDDIVIEDELIQNLQQLQWMGMLSGKMKRSQFWSNQNRSYSHQTNNKKPLMFLNKQSQYEQNRQQQGLENEQKIQHAETHKIIQKQRQQGQMSLQNIYQQFEFMELNLNKIAHNKNIPKIQNLNILLKSQKNMNVSYFTNSINQSLDLDNKKVIHNTPFLQQNPSDQSLQKSCHSIPQIDDNNSLQQQLYQLQRNDQQQNRHQNQINKNQNKVPCQKYNKQTNQQLAKKVFNSNQIQQIDPLDIEQQNQEVLQQNNMQKKQIISEKGLGNGKGRGMGRGKGIFQEELQINEQDSQILKQLYSNSEAAKDQNLQQIMLKSQTRPLKIQKHQYQLSISYVSVPKSCQLVPTPHSPSLCPGTPKRRIPNLSQIIQHIKQQKNEQQYNQKGLGRGKVFGRGLGVLQQTVQLQKQMQQDGIYLEDSDKRQKQIIKQNMKGKKKVKKSEQQWKFNLQQEQQQPVYNQQKLDKFDQMVIMQGQQVEQLSQLQLRGQKRLNSLKEQQKPPKPTNSQKMQQKQLLQQSPLNQQEDRAEQYSNMNDEDLLQDDLKDLIKLSNNNKQKNSQKEQKIHQDGENSSLENNGNNHNAELFDDIDGLDF